MFNWACQSAKEFCNKLLNFLVVHNGVLYF